MALFQSDYSCIIITGGSRGFGLSLIKELIQQFQNDSKNHANKSRCHFLIVTRNEIPSEIKNIPNKDLSIVIETIYCDLSKADTVENKIKPIFENLKKLPIKHCFLFHNSGTLGDVNTLCEEMPLSENNNNRLISYYELNVFSVMKLTSLALQTFQKFWPDFRLHIVNISSLAALQSFYGCNDYCTGKATRQAYFRQLNLELSQKYSNRNYRILNWAPGPLSTNMFSVLQNDSLISDQFKNLEPLKPQISAQALIFVLIKDDFKNAEHIDFYDVKQN